LFDAAPPTSRQSVAKHFSELQGADHNDILFVARDEYTKNVGDFLAAVKARP
jgi:hypothetical protein